MAHLTTPPLNTCFVISPIGEPNTSVRKRSDQILKHLVAPACKASGYNEPLRSDKIDESGMITSQIVQHLIDDALVVADLTDHNPNVFYELAIRHSFRRPVIQLIQAGQRVPFDVHNLRTVIVDVQDPDVLERAREELITHMQLFRDGRTEAESPVSVAVDISSLRSGNAKDREVARVVDELEHMKKMISDLETTILREIHNGAAWPSLGRGKRGSLGELMSRHDNPFEIFNPPVSSISRAEAEAIMGKRLDDLFDQPHTNRSSTQDDTKK